MAALAGRRWVGVSALAGLLLRPLTAIPAKAGTRTNTMNLGKLPFCKVWLRPTTPSAISESGLP